MKRSKFFLPALLAAVVFLGACGNGKDDQDGADTMAVSGDTSTPVAVPLPDLMVVMHKVANFSKWRAAYDGHDSARTAAGLHSYVIARGLEDSNQVLVALRMDDTARARQFGASADLQAHMKKAGVTSKPDADMSDIIWMDPATNTTDTRVMVRHAVKDYASWRTVFDSHKQARIDAGLSDRIIARSMTDSNQVTVVFGINDMEKAKAFMASKDLKDRMASAGVVGQPRIFMYRVVERY